VAEHRDILERNAGEAGQLVLPKRSFWRMTWRHLRGKPLGAIGLVLVLIIALVAIFADVIAPFEYQVQSYDSVKVAPGATNPATGNVHVFGTDELGRDVFSRVVHGARISLIVGFASVLLGTGVGALLGLISGYFMGYLDSIVQRLIDMWMALPDLILALVVVAVLGEQSTQILIVAIAATILPRGVRVIRASTISLRESDYVLSARAIGSSDWRVILRHIAPNSVAPFLIIMSSMFGTAILTEAGLSFLGLGIEPPTPSWGGMLTGQAAQFLRTAPWMLVFPGLDLSITVLGFAFAGDALRDILDPRQRGR